MGGPFNQIDRSASSRLATAISSTNANWFAVHNSRHGVTLMSGVGIHEPCHDLFIGTHVRAHDVRVRPDERDHFLHVTPGNSLHFAGRKLSWIAINPALRASVGETGQGALPTHPHRQSSDLSERDSWRE